MNILVELDRLIKTEANVIAVLPERESTIATVIEASTRSTGVVVIVSPNLTGVARALSLLPAAIQARTLLIGPGLTHAELDLRQMDIEAHRYAIVCITPGRLQSFPLVRALGEASVTRVICLDSASIHQGSGRFYPEYGIIFELLSLLNDPPVIFFSTTATRRSLDDISNRLSRRPVVLLGDIVPRTAFLIINKCCDEENRLAKLTRLVANRHGSGIVYVNSRQQGYRVEQRLRQGGSSVRLYHAGLGSAERAAIVDRFQSAEVPILVATHAYVQTDALPVLRYIIHYSPPPSLDLYVRNIAALGLHDKISLSCVLTMADEDDELRRWSRKAFVSADCLEAVYNALSIAIAGPVGLVDEGAVLDLVSQQGYDDIDLWLCISLLERAGVVRRGFDAPRAATVLIRDSGLTGDDVEWAQFLAIVRDAKSFRLQQSVPLDIALVARKLAKTSPQLEHCLVEWQHRGLLTYSGIGRAPWLHIGIRSQEISAAIDSVVQEGRQSREQGIEEIVGFLTAHSCLRKQLIMADYEQPSPPCRRCSWCRASLMKRLGFR